MPEYFAKALVNPKEIDKIVDFLKQEGVDHFVNPEGELWIKLLNPRFHHGFLSAEEQHVSDKQSRYYIYLVPFLVLINVNGIVVKHTEDVYMVVLLPPIH